MARGRQHTEPPCPLRLELELPLDSYDAVQEYIMHTEPSDITPVVSVWWNR